MSVTRRKMLEAIDEIPPSEGYVVYENGVWATELGSVTIKNALGVTYNAFTTMNDNVDGKIYILKESTTSKNTGAAFRPENIIDISEYNTMNIMIKVTIPEGTAANYITIILGTTQSQTASGGQRIYYESPNYQLFKYHNYDVDNSWKQFSNFGQLVFSVLKSYVGVEIEISKIWLTQEVQTIES